MRKFEIETIYKDHLESSSLRTKKEADKLFEEKKEEFKTNEEIKEISLFLVTLYDDKISKEPFERVERKNQE